MPSNFNSTTPAAPAGFTNVVFQTDGNGNDSAYVPTSSGTPGGSSGDIQFNNGAGGFGGSAATINTAGSITIPEGQVIEWSGGYGPYSTAAISALASDTLAIGDGSPGDVSGAAAMTALILFGSSSYYDYNLFHTTIYSGAEQNWSLILPPNPGTSGQVLTTNGSGVTYWETPSGGGGSVTSFSSGNLSPLFTTSVATPTTTPALSFSLNTQNANTVFAGPTSGGAAAPTFRALVAADLPAVSSAWATLTGDLTETQVIPWDGGTVGTPDTGISRISAGVLGIGTGAQGSIAGSLSLANATISGLTTASAITGSLAGLKLATPSAPTITPNTSGGGTSYSYKIVAKDQNGTTLAGILSTCGSIASTAGSTSTGQSVLSGSVYNTLAWAAVTGAVSYDVYRTVGGATQGYIGNTSLLTFNDTGLTGNGWTAPAYNTSGSVVDAFDSQAGNGNFFTSIDEVWKSGAPTGYGGVGATNRVDMTLRYVSETMVVNKITVLNSASANASETAGFGMYDQNLNLVAHTTFAHTVLVAGGTPTAYSSAVLEATPPTIVPGWYWFAFTSSGTTIAATFGYYGSSATAAQYLCIVKNVTRITRGGNAASVGVLPATQTLQGTNDGYSGMFVVYET